MWVVLVLVGCCLGASGGGTETVKELLGKRRGLKDAFTPKNSCTGSVTLRDEKGKEYVVNNTELNVNFKPSSIELLGKDYDNAQVCVKYVGNCLKCSTFSFLSFLLEEAINIAFLYRKPWKFIDLEGTK